MPRRIEKKYHYIYKTICNVTGRYYYGMHSTDNLEDGYIGSGTRLWYSINKHGKENHQIEILEFFENREKLKAREAEIINEDLLQDPMCMNLQLGGGGGFSSKEHKEKCMISMTKAFKEKLKDPEFFENFREHNRNNMIENHKNGLVKYDTFKNKKHSSKTKKLIGTKNSISQSGANNSQYGTCWITNEKENRKIHRGDEISEGWRLGRKIKI